MPDSNSDFDADSSSDGSCDGESIALAPLVKRELDRGSKRSHSMHLYRPPSLVGSAIGKFSYGASIARGPCGVWKVRSALLASLKTKMSRDGSCKSAMRRLRLGRSCIPRNPMPKLPPLPRVLCPPPPPSPTSPPLAMEELDDHPNAPTETVPPAPCSNTTQPSHTGMVSTRPVCGDDVLAAVCHALTNGPGSPTAQLQHVESLLRDEWE